jgi:hypothetical protein
MRYAPYDSEDHKSYLHINTFDRNSQPKCLYCVSKKMFVGQG